MSETAIEIDRVPLRFIAATSPDRAERLSRRVRDAVARTLPAALSAACGRELHADPAYIFIDRLEVACSVAAHWPDEAIAARLAERIARALLLERSLGQALVFRDRAEFLSAFLAAVVDGQAASRWWFAEFDGLAPLPVSTCLRTLVIQEGPVALEALARLAAEALRRILSALAVPDVELVLAAVSAGPAGPTPSTRRLLDALETSARAALLSSPHRRLAALLHVLRTGGGAASPECLVALEAIDRLTDAARSGRLPPPLPTAPSTVEQWCEAAGCGAMARSAVKGLDAEMLMGHLAARGLPPEEGAPPADCAEAFSFTRFGGALLLCVVLVRAGWWAAWREALREAGHGDRSDMLAAWLALAVTARALDPRQPAAIERDRVLQRVFGLPEELRPVASRAMRRALCEALSSLPAAAGPLPRERHLGPWLRACGGALLSEFGRRVPGCAGSSPGYLRTRCLSLNASVSGDGSAARLGRAPLDVLLVFSGLKRASVTLPDGRKLALSEEEVW